MDARARRLGKLALVSYCGSHARVRTVLLSRRDGVNSGGTPVKEIVLRSGAVLGAALAIGLIQSASNEGVALASPALTLPAGSAIPADYALTNGGIYRHKSCIVPVPKNARVWPDR